MLNVEGLRSRYGRIEVLHGIDLAVNSGEIVTVVGANGAGKTTLLNTIAGVLAPHKGSIRLAGEEIGGLDADAVCRSGAVLVPEGRQVFPFLSVSENLAMGAFARRGDPAVRRDVEQVYDWFPRLRERHRQPAGQLSGGEQQMLAIGRAYMAKPRLLLLDEPSLGLSPLFTKEVFSIVRRIREQAGIAVLVVEQNAAIALDTADHGYVLELGRVATSASCDALRQRADIKDFYLGTSSPPNPPRRPA